MTDFKHSQVAVDTPNNELQYNCEVCYQSFESSDMLIFHLMETHPVLQPKSSTTHEKHKRESKPSASDSKSKKPRMNYEGENSVENGSNSSPTSKNIDHPLQFRCEKCFELFASAQILKRHCIAQHVSAYDNTSSQVDDNSTPEYTCEVCCKFCDSPAMLRAHCFQYHADNQDILNSKKMTIGDTNVTNHDTTNHNTNLTNHDTANRDANMTSTLIGMNAGEDGVNKVETDMAMNSGGNDVKVETNTHPIINKRIAFKFKCGVCFTSFNNNQKFDGHLKEHINTKSFVLDIIYDFDCTIIIVSKKLQELWDVHECRMCERLFKRRNHFKQHIKFHTGEKPYECELCHKHFAAPANLDNHKLTHLNQKPFQCEDCSKTFARELDLNRHKATHKKGFQCNVCLQRFGTRNQFRSHNYLKHDGGVIFKCDVMGCSHAFIDKDEHIRHRLKHSVNKKYLL